MTLIWSATLPYCIVRVNNKSGSNRKLKLCAQAEELHHGCLDQPVLLPGNYAKLSQKRQSKFKAVVDPLKHLNYACR